MVKRAFTSLTFARVVLKQHQREAQLQQNTTLYFVWASAFALVPTNSVAVGLVRFAPQREYGKSEGDLIAYLRFI